MNFHRADPNSHFRTLRLVSADGRWELGMNPYSHGMRMRMGLSGRPPQVIDFCMGRDGAIFPQVLIAVLARLEPLDESCGMEMIDAAFPWAGTRPDMAVHLGALLEPQRIISSTG